MKCSICGKELNGHGYNPYPLSKENGGSLCCEECNTNYVIPSRVFILNDRYVIYNDKYIRYTLYERIHTGNEIMILWMSDKQTQEEYILKKGIITEIKDDLLYGTWGNFPINIKKDKFAVFED